MPHLTRGAARPQRIQPEAAKAAPVQGAPPVGLTPEARLQEAQAIAHRNVLWSLGAGVVPFPIVDLLAVAAVELKMLREIAKVYDINFQEGIAKKIIGSLLASIGVVGIGGIIGGSLAKFVPGIGTTLSLIHSIFCLCAAGIHRSGGGGPGQHAAARLLADAGRRAAADPRGRLHRGDAVRPQASASDLPEVLALT